MKEISPDFPTNFNLLGIKPLLGMKIVKKSNHFLSLSFSFNSFTVCTHTGIILSNTVSRWREDEQEIEPHRKFLDDALSKAMFENSEHGDLLHFFLSFLPHSFYMFIVTLKFWNMVNWLLNFGTVTSFFGLVLVPNCKWMCSAVDNAKGFMVLL